MNVKELKELLRGLNDESFLYFLPSFEGREAESGKDIVVEDSLAVYDNGELKILGGLLSVDHVTLEESL